MARPFDLLSELFANSREVAKSRKVKQSRKVETSRKVAKSKSARKGNDDTTSHPPKGPGACRVLLAGVSFLKAFLLEADSL